MNANNSHTHEFKYIAEPVKELVKDLGDEIESAAHVFTVVHKHDGGHVPHHHTGTDVAPTAADKSKPEPTQDPKPEPETEPKSRLWYER